jgi:ADP-heptose:LPS heptosyltransferase
MLPMPLPSAANFPEATPLHAFFAWNEARRVRDRRHTIACDILALLQELGDDAAARQACAARLVPDPAGAAAARQLIDSIVSSRGSADTARHAAVFAAFETLAAEIDLSLLANRHRVAPARRRSGRVLVIKLGALGDFVQALGPVPAIRRKHAGDRISLLTTPAYAGFAEATGLFDEILVDRRPRWFDVAGWLSLGRMLRRGRFDRVYDLQTSDRSSAYAWLLRGGRTSEWCGIARHCSHPHANPDRDRLHTIDRQAEQLLMAGVYPVPLVDWLPATGGGPIAADIRAPFALLIPGSSPGHPEKRWPAHRYARLAAGFAARGCLPVVVGVKGEEDIARAIRDLCPDAVDLVGQTDIAALVALARAAALTVGNDTGATHVAAAGGNPVVVLFSQASQPELCAPRGERVRIVARPDLADLPVEEVAAEAEAALLPALADAQ